MSEAALDPYAVLGVTPEISDVELRRVYRALVKRHHPDHNGGSAESAARFAQIQNAYAALVRRRETPAAPPEPEIEQRIADLERQMAAARLAEQARIDEQARLVREREAARRAAAEFQATSGAQGDASGRPTPEELGYYSTDDSFTKIFDDAADRLVERLGGAETKKQFARRLSDLFGHED
jgi:hypothetical protein